MGALVPQAMAVFYSGMAYVILRRGQGGMPLSLASFGTGVALSLIGASLFFQTNETNEIAAWTGALVPQAMAVFYSGMAYVILRRGQGGMYLSLSSFGTGAALSLIGIGFFWNNEIAALAVALITLGMAVFYGGLAYAAWQRGEDGRLSAKCRPGPPWYS